jgi:hypothetical protein
MAISYAVLCNAGGNYPSLKECTHLYKGVLLETYDIVPVHQSCPAIPDTLHSTNNSNNSNKLHRIGDPDCTKGSLNIDL